VIERHKIVQNAINKRHPIGGPSHPGNYRTSGRVAAHRGAEERKGSEGFLLDEIMGSIANLDTWPVP